MTNEEKAGTFIGWKQGEFHCEHGFYAPHTLQPWMTSTGVQEMCDKQIMEDAPLPLTNPVAFLKAIEMLISKLLMIEISEGSYTDGDPYIFTIKTANIAFSPNYENYKFTGKSTKSLAEAATSAMAKLYDAMHEGDGYEF